MNQVKKNDNPRGYAFVAFSRAYETMLSYDWAAALRATSAFPTKWDWIADCLRTYDVLALDSDDTPAIVTAVLKEYRASLYSTVRGGFTSTNPNMDVRISRKYEVIDPYLLAHAHAVAAEDDDMLAIEDASEMRTRMRILHKKLTSKEYEALAEYVATGSSSFKETVMVDLGWTKQEYDSVRRSIRYKCKGLVF